MTSRKLSSIKKWFMAIRPSSLILSSASVFLGIGLAAGDGVSHVPSAAMCLLGAWLLHILVNLVNDYGDFEKGVDKKWEYDPMRGILVGEISQTQLRNAINVVLLLLTLPCAYLITRAGWPIILISIFSILAAIFYTVGKKPLGYRGFGDILVLIFFGPVAVAGTYYAQSLEMNLAIFIAGFIPGLFSVGVLTINNIRDFEKDKKAGKTTLVVLFGKEFGKAEYLSVIFVSSLIPLLIYALISDHPKIVWTCLIFLPAIPIIKKVFANEGRASMDAAIGMNVMLCFFYCVIFSISWILR